MVKYILHTYRYGQKDFLSQKVELAILIHSKLHQKVQVVTGLGKIDTIGCRFPQQEFMELKISSNTKISFVNQ